MTSREGETVLAWGKPGTMTSRMPRSGIRISDFSFLSMIFSGKPTAVVCLRRWMSLPGWPEHVEFRLRLREHASFMPCADNRMI
ncbi:hypothetical protein WL40_25655 [Burkholderia ubonensis]|nr:hypothetical protein WJ92_18605 [Burkholderia ubonensis]KWB83095.1 hypothetical protein WL40_25655 [Burkholderia ubonensis]